MAEDVGLNGVLGGNDAGAEATVELAGPSLDPAAAAMAVQAAGANPKLAAAATTYFRRQADLVRIQIEEMDEVRAVVLSQLKLRRFSDALKVALQCFIILVATGLGVGILKMTWDAANDRGLVVQAFTVPPDVAQRGLTGQVMAALVLDRIAELDHRAQSVRAASSYHNDWGNDIKVEIPTTGISFDELDRFLHKWLGKRTVISGDLFRSGDLITLTVRTGDGPPLSATGPEAKLPDLVQRIAEQLYGLTQPYRYSKYLERANRLPEALTVARQMVLNGSDPKERAWAYAQISNLLEWQGDIVGGVAAARESLRLAPDLALGAVNAGGGEQMLGHDEAALRDYALVKKLFARPGSDISGPARASLPIVYEAASADLLGDYQAADAAYEKFGDSPTFQDLQTHALGERAFEHAQAHDVSGSRALRARAPDPEVDVTFTPFFPTPGNAILPQYVEAAEEEDWQAAISDLERVTAATASLGPVGELQRKRFLDPRRAYALARLGHSAEAQALIAATPLDCYLCVRMRGRIAAIGHDFTAGEQWFREATRQAPSLPFAYADWAQMELERGQVGAAISLLAEAHKLAPRYADPLERWGEALMRNGYSKAAAEKFSEAARYAPRWAHLHLMWSRALARAGRRDAAQTELARARSLHLTSADLASLSRSEL